jgi:hypothetical protein
MYTPPAFEAARAGSTWSDGFLTHHKWTQDIDIRRMSQQELFSPLALELFCGRPIGGESRTIRRLLLLLLLMLNLMLLLSLLLR